MIIISIIHPEEITSLKVFTCTKAHQVVVMGVAECLGHAPPNRLQLVKVKDTTLEMKKLLKTFSLLEHVAIATAE